MQFINLVKLKRNNFEIKYPEKKDKLEIEPNPCWEGYEPIGLKDDGTPNCVPIKEEQKAEKFVIPAPESGEAEDKYISRCMHAIADEYDTQEQALAVCYAQLEK